MTAGKKILFNEGYFHANRGNHRDEIDPAVTGTYSFYWPVVRVK